MVDEDRRPGPTETKLTWTPELPQCEGWFWFCEGVGKDSVPINPRILEIFKAVDGKLTVQEFCPRPDEDSEEEYDTGWYELSGSYKEEGCYWAGPVDRPPNGIVALP